MNQYHVDPRPYGHSSSDLQAGLSRHSYRVAQNPHAGLADLARLDKSEAKLRETADAEAFVRGRQVFAGHGLELTEPETYWSGRHSIAVRSPRPGVPHAGTIREITEREAYAASQYGDGAGCMYFYLHRLLRPVQSMLAGQ